MDKLFKLWYLKLTNNITKHKINKVIMVFETRILLMYIFILYTLIMEYILLVLKISIPNDFNFIIIVQIMICYWGKFYIIKFNVIQVPDAKN